MGASSQPAGYNYRVAWHDGLGKGPWDAFTEFRGADKTAWKGRVEVNTAIPVVAPNLWGGKKDQGGPDGTLTPMFGLAGQLPNAALVSMIGPKITASRGMMTVAWHGIWGANNPFQQKRSYRGERTYAGWDNDDCWYPETVRVPIADGGGVVTTLINPDVILSSEDTSLDGSAGGFDFTVPPGATIIIELGPSSDGWSFTPSDDYQPENYSYLTWWNHFGLIEIGGGGAGGTYWPERFGTAAEARAAHAGDRVEIFAPSGGTWRLYLRDAEVDDNRGNGSYKVSYSLPAQRIAKNPAHMILEMHTQKHCGRQPRDSVNLDHLTTQADWFYSRGFGLCTVRNPKETSPREFIKRIEQVAGCSFTKSLADGLWYLDVANGIYDLDSLPIINDDHVLKFQETASVSDNVVNSVSVKYFDPERNEIVITPPIKAMGLIAQFGEIHQTFEYLEIPIGRIALEVAERELLARITPTRAFELDCNPGVYELRRNQYVRLQLPKRGIADMVCLVAEIPTSGSLKSGAFQLKLAQDIYSLPTTEYVVELGEDTSPPTTPAEIDGQVAFEAPYIDVVANMPPADFEALPADAGYVVGAAVDPGRMRDFTMMVAPDGGEYDDVGDGPFCPSCTSTGLVEPGLELGIGYSDASRMASVQVGDLGYWLAEDGKAELVRVDAIDLGANTLDLGRGCGDTIPKRHLAGSRMFFYQSAAAFDRTQHIAGEALDVKLLTNSYTEQQDIDDATLLPVTMAERIARPYPNGKMEINGVSIFAIGTSTPGGGGGGGPGGGGPTTPPAQSPSGGPASPVPGPYNGFPDDAPYPVPQPPVGGDVIDDGGFDTPGYPTGWTNEDGTPLDSRWFVGSDGKLHYQGVGSSKAYYLPAKFSLPWQPLPRYDIASAADVAAESPARASIGAAWGVSTAGGRLNFESVSAPKSYPAEEAVAHSFIYAPSGLVSGINYVDQIPIVTFAPVLSVESDSGLVVNVTFDNVVVTPAIIPMPTTPDALPNLDFSSGLANWSLYPDPTGNPNAPTISTSGGELSMTVNSAFWKLQNFIHDTALSPNEIGRYTGTDFESWSDDTTVVRGFTQSGVIIGFAIKYLGVVTGIVYSGSFQRGDWTARQTWLRQHVDGTVTPGITLHHLVALRAEPTFTSKIRGQAVATTNAVIDADPIP